MTVHLSTQTNCRQPQPVESSSVDFVQSIAQDCLRCKKCVRECDFLQSHSTPGVLAAGHLAGKAETLEIAYFCSLCGLCTELCPQSLPVAQMFLDLRRQAVEIEGMAFREHNVLRRYEAIGNSRLFIYYHLPAGCDTVFFPGCALPGIRRKETWQLFERLQDDIPALGLVLDCCNKPSHDLGYQDQFVQKFRQKVQRLDDAGVKTIVTSCPSCYQIFRQYSNFEVLTVFTLLVQPTSEETILSTLFPPITIHDPCTIRFEDDVQQAVRGLIQQKGGQIKEMDHSCRRTLCCGEGGGTKFLSTEKSGNWGGRRFTETGDMKMVTYCAGCTRSFALARPIHLVDLLFAPVGKLFREKKMVPAPFTYLNRLLLKIKLIFKLIF